MAALPVEKFVGEITDPTDAQLHAFYDQYKDSFPQPNSPTPGFKQPMRAQYQYFKADDEKLVAQELPKVTEKEIKDYYDQFKDVFFKKTTLPDEPGKTSDKPGDKSSDTKAGGKADSKSAAPPAKPEAGKSDDSKKSDGKKQSRTSPSRSSINGELLALADDAQLELAQASKSGAAKSDAQDTRHQDTRHQSRRTKTAADTRHRQRYQTGDAARLPVPSNTSPSAKFPIKSATAWRRKKSNTKSTTPSTPCGSS